MHMLAINPAKQDKLRDEINQALPTKDSAFTVDNMKNLPYLRAVIKETLRLRPAVIGTLRATGQDLVIQGYQIPKGVMTRRRCMKGICKISDFSDKRGPFECTIGPERGKLSPQH
jgi:Cytochrome P450